MEEQKVLLDTMKSLAEEGKVRCNFLLYIIIANREDVKSDRLFASRDGRTKVTRRHDGQSR